MKDHPVTREVIFSSSEEVAAVYVVLQLTAPADGSIRPCGSGPGSLPVRGLPARGAIKPRGRVQLARGTLSRGSGGTGGRDLTFLQARDQLRSFATTPMKLTRGTLSSVARVVTSTSRDPLPPSRASSAPDSTPVGPRGPTPTLQESSGLSTASSVQPTIEPAMLISTPLDTCIIEQILKLLQTHFFQLN